MIKKALRLNGGEVAQVLKKGLSLHSKLFTIKFLKVLETERKKEGYAVIVSKKIAKKANLRNLLRRRSYEAIRALKRHSQGKFVLIAKNQLSESSYQEINKDLENIFSNGKI